MNSRQSILFAITAVMLMSTISCAGSTGSLVTPPLSPDGAASTAQHDIVNSGANHSLWGYYLVHIDPARDLVEVTPLRLAASHWNTLSWLEQAPCTDCLSIVAITPSDHGTLLVDLELKHPFPNPNFTGFDVRGIVMFSGSLNFPLSGHNTSNPDLGDGALINGDGYTALYNPATEGCGPGGLQGYIPGKLSTLTYPDATLNPFKRYISEDPANTRNAFYAGDTLVVTLDIDMPDGPFIFGYAIDANWATPLKEPVEDPMTDFGPEANCPEPWKIEVVQNPIGNGLTNHGGSTELTIDVYDWQGKDTHYTPVLECPDLFNGALWASHDQDFTGYSRWKVMVENKKLAGEGEYKCLISVEDEENNYSEDCLDLTAYQMVHLPVIYDPEQTPVAFAEAYPVPQGTGDPLLFADIGSVDPDGGDIVTFEWDWENDGIFDEEGQYVFHSWDSAGTYYVQLRVTDDEGKSDTLDEALEVIILDDFIVLFPDPNLESAVRLAIDKPAGDIYKSDLHWLAELYTYELGISNLEGLQYCAELAVLKLTYENIIDISQIRCLINLTVLDLRYNQISDIKALIALINLTWMDVSGNQIININSLAGLANLTHLSLYNNQLSDISALGTLVSLTWLDLTVNQISLIGPLASLESLTLLSIGQNQINNLTPLAELYNLESLVAHGNQISDLEPLRNLTNLTMLHLGGNDISYIIELQELINLTFLNIDCNNIKLLDGIENLTQLTTLELWSNEIDDITLLAGLINLSKLQLDNNEISNDGYGLWPLQPLLNLTELHLRNNLIDNIEPLVENGGLGDGDAVWLTGNPLNGEDIEDQISTLEANGVVVFI